MKQKVSKNLWKKVLTDKPALVKKLVDPSEDLLVEMIEANPRVIRFLPDELKSVKICNTALKKGLPTPSYWATPDENIIPKHLFLEVNQELLAKELTNHPHFIKAIPNPTHQMWKATGSDFRFPWEEIPKEHQTEDVAEDRIIARGTANFDIHIPDPVWTEHLAEFAVEVDPKLIEQIPTRLLTRELLMKAFGTAGTFNFISISGGSWDYRGLNIPDHLWDNELATAVVRNCHSNIQSIPDNHLTKELVLECDNQVDITKLPQHLQKDRDIQIAVLPHTHKDKVKEIHFPELRDSQFQLDAITHDPSAAEKLMEANIKLDWVSILKAQPNAIQFLDKRDQTDEHISTFLSAASHEVIDKAAEHLNKARINKEHCLLMIGVEDKELISIIERKLKGGTRPRTQVHKKPQEETILINMPPKEFNLILREYDREEDKE